MPTLSRRLVIALAASLLALAFHVTSSACAAIEADAPRSAALETALAAHARHIRQLGNRRLLTLIDYDLPFTAERLWVIDLAQQGRVVHRSRVSHAWKSGALFASQFSNVPGSYLSSLGSYVTAARTYSGSFGHSLRVRGLEAGVNDNAYRRDIVFHPAGMLSHSLGCFMLPDAQVRNVLDSIAGGSFVYVYRTPRD
jgi:hypothetical protein